MSFKSRSKLSLEFRDMYITSLFSHEENRDHSSSIQLRPFQYNLFAIFARAFRPGSAWVSQRNNESPSVLLLSHSFSLPALPSSFPPFLPSCPSFPSTFHNFFFLTSFYSQIYTFSFFNSFKTSWNPITQENRSTASKNSLITLTLLRV